MENGNQPDLDRSDRSAHVVARTRALRRLDRGQAGDMLIEVLVAVVIMAIVVVTGLMALGVGVQASATHQAIVRSSAEAAIAAEHVEQLEYVPCTAATPPTAASYQAALSTLLQNPYVAQPSLSLELVNLQFLQDSSASPPTFGPCPAEDQGLQRLVVRVTTVDGAGRSVTGSIPFLKRNTHCAGVPTTLGGQTC